MGDGGWGMAAWGMGLPWTRWIGPRTREKPHERLSSRSLPCLDINHPPILCQLFEKPLQELLPVEQLCWGRRWVGERRGAWVVGLLQHGTRVGSLPHPFCCSNAPMELFQCPAQVAEQLCSGEHMFSPFSRCCLPAYAGRRAPGLDAIAKTRRAPAPVPAGALHPSIPPPVLSSATLCACRLAGLLVARRPAKPDQLPQSSKTSPTSSTTTRSHPSTDRTPTPLTPPTTPNPRQ
jgi:hypothetical protein